MAPRLAQAAGEFFGPSGEGFAPNEGGRGVSFVKAALAAIVMETSAAENFDTSCHGFGLSVVKKFSGITLHLYQHLLVQPQGDSREGLSYSCKLLAIASLLKKKKKKF